MPEPTRQVSKARGGWVTPQQFIHKWRPVALTERQTAQEHFGDLCRLLGQPTPIEADPEGNDYAFEKGATRATGGRGFSLNPTGTLSRRHLAQFVSAIDTPETTAMIINTRCGRNPSV
jgi:hypothetical protein